MPENENNVNTTDQAPTPTPTSTPKDKKKKPNRTIEELHQASIKGMSESELRMYAGALRDALVESIQKTEQLMKNCDSAYEKVRLMEQRHQRFSTEAKAKLHFASQTIAQAHNAIIMAGGLEE